MITQSEKLYLYIHGLAEGLTHAEIAARAGVTVRTVYNWRKKFIMAMGCKSIYQAVMLIAIDLQTANSGPVGSPAARVGDPAGPGRSTSIYEP